MSTLKANAINNISASAGGIQIDSSGAISGALPYPNRNLLYNGAMQVAQRGTSATGITSVGYYTADRWNTNIGSLGTWTQSVENDAPEGSGFRKSLKMLCTTADSTPAGGDYNIIQQLLEGQNVQQIVKGTSSAKKLTLSFWVKSNVTGTYTIELRDHNNTRQVSSTYNVAVSNTWEHKVITFPADTIGILNNDNARSLDINFWLGAGTNWTSGTLNTEWNSITNANRAVGQTNLAAATNNYWQITGVQLEVSDTATEFEHLPFGVELLRCKRYYQKSFEYSQVPINNTTTNTSIQGNYAFVPAGGTTSGAAYNQGRTNFEVEMRIKPHTVQLFQPNGSAGNAGNLGKFGDVVNSTVTTSYNAVYSSQSTTKTIIVQFNNGSAFNNAGNPYGVHWTASAEL